MKRTRIDWFDLVAVALLSFIAGVIFLLTKSAGGLPLSLLPQKLVAGRQLSSPSSEASPGLASKSVPDSGFNIIRKAADRNNCYGDDFLILLAIRKAENGSAGKEFGVKRVWGTDLETQAAWAAATVVKSRGRWEKAGRPNDFINYLAQHYCPLDSFNWGKNVRFWFERFKK